ncbi:MAG: AMP-binding protein [Schleiferiaceae bacterium]
MDDLCFVISGRLKPCTKVAESLNNIRKNIHPDFSLFYKGEKQSLSEDSNVEVIRQFQHFLDSWNSDSQSLEVQTSGSTGQPKKIEIQKDFMIASAEKTLEFFGLEPKDKTLLCMDLMHIGAQMMVIRAFLGGLELHITEPKLKLSEDLSHGFDFVPMVPAQAMESLDSLSIIKKVLLGGAPLSHSDLSVLHGVDSSIYQSFGMTETISHIALKKISEEAYSAVNGVSFSTTANDELIISAPHIGINLLPTHDVVELLSANRFIWKGRSDNTINSGGKKIQPEAVENLLAPHIIGNFAISDAPHPQWGRQVVLVLESGSKTEIPKILEYPPYSEPKKVIRIPTIPRTENGKIKRAELREMISSEW